MRQGDYWVFRRSVGSDIARGVLFGIFLELLDEMISKGVVVAPQPSRIPLLVAERSESAHQHLVKIGDYWHVVCARLLYSGFQSCWFDGVNVDHRIASATAQTDLYAQINKVHEIISFAYID